MNSDGRLLRLKDVCESLSLSPSTLYRLAEAGKVPCYKIGGALRFKGAEVDAWLKSKCRRGRFVDFGKLASYDSTAVSGEGKG